jgi:hypothetical protein
MTNVPFKEVLEDVAPIYNMLETNETHPFWQLV